MVEGTGAYLITVKTVDGDKYVFDRRTPMRIVTGMGIPESRITNSANPLQNFSYVEYRTFAPRKLAVVIQIAGGSNRSVWATRQQLIRIFNPLRGPFTFILSYPNKNEMYYAYEVLLTDVMDAPLDTKGDARYAEFPLSLTAYDPFWYGAEHTEEYAIEEEETLVVSAGTAFAKPIVTFTGPLTDPELTNEIWAGVTPYKLHVLGAIAAGDSVVVDTRLRTVTRTSGAGVALSYDSTLNSFGLIPATLGALGNNHIDSSADVAYVGNQITLTWQDRFCAL